MAMYTPRIMLRGSGSARGTVGCGAPGGPPGCGEAMLAV
jgi:hypothetical protein